MNDRSRKAALFEKETKFLSEVNSIHIDQSKEEVFAAFDKLRTNYDRLVGEAKLITTVSDRLHHKLNIANEKLEEQAEKINIINQDLQNNNQILQDTIEQLVKAKVERKAATIVLLIAILLFLLSEGVLEPIIEDFTDSEMVGLLFKGLIALLLRPIDFLVERYLMSRRLRGQKNLQSIPELSPSKKEPRK